MAKAKKKPATKRAEKGAGESFLSACAGNFEAIQALVGDVKFKSLKEVADAFGKSIDTIKGNWRSNGMPGVNGNYPLALILAWKLQRDALTAGASPDGAPVSASLDRKRSAEARMAEAEAAKRERMNVEAAGTLLYRDDVERQIGSAIILARESLRRIPRAMMPHFPQKLAVELTEDLRKRIDAVLSTLAETKFDWAPTEPDETETTPKE